MHASVSGLLEQVLPLFGKTLTDSFSVGCNKTDACFPYFHVESYTLIYILEEKHHGLFVAADLVPRI